MKRSLSLFLLLSIIAGTIYFSKVAKKPQFHGDVNNEAELSFRLDSGKLSIFALGGTGSGGMGQKAVSARMAEEHQSQPVNALFFLGANFFFSGVSSTSDPQWQNKYTEVYPASLFDLPVFAILGSVDHRDNPRAQIEYTSVDNRWTMPGHYYSVHYSLRDGTSVLFLAIDTQLMKHRGDLRKQQLTWLKEKLSNSSDTWKVVVGYHPVIFNGRPKGEAKIYPHLVPLLRTYADIYLSGNGEAIEILKPLENFTQVVSGAGSRSLDIKSAENSVYATGRQGFVRLDFTRSEIEIIVSTLFRPEDFSTTIRKQ